MESSTLTNTDAWETPALDQVVGRLAPSSGYSLETRKYTNAVLMNVACCTCMWPMAKSAILIKNNDNEKKVCFYPICIYVFILLFDHDLTRNVPMRSADFFFLTMIYD